MANALDRMKQSPVLARTLPFAVFALLTVGQGKLGDTSQFWVYALKTAIGAWLLWTVRPTVGEMRWSFSWEALAAGVGVFVVWVGLDPFYPKLAVNGIPFNPHEQFGDGSIAAWGFIAVRLAGSSLVVPPLEEVFYRSFLYRYLVRPDFQEVPFSRFDARAFLILALAFGIAHYEWLPGILCAIVYQWLVIRNNRLGDAITAHAITNVLLGLWVVFRPAWHFW
jgi:hypothetical protein